ncbi:MAG TPA: hypothetical protein VGN14_14105 [Candidatus Elarobacter sp.]
MSNDPTPGKPKTVFDDDDLDDAVIAADDTGMIASEKFITDSEIEEAVEAPDER